MYTLMNGEKVENLRFASTGVEAWEQSQYYWYYGKKVCQMLNGETSEVRVIDVYGNDVEIVKT